jgi:hypothetical protein
LRGGIALRSILVLKLSSSESIVISFFLLPAGLEFQVTLTAEPSVSERAGEQGSVYKSSSPSRKTVSLDRKRLGDEAVISF